MQLLAAGMAAVTFDVGNIPFTGVFAERAAIILIIRYCADTRIVPAFVVFSVHSKNSSRFQN
jgi:hypothetical protein